MYCVLRWQNVLLPRVLLPVIKLLKVGRAYLHINRGGAGSGHLHGYHQDPVRMIWVDVEERAQCSLNKGICVATGNNGVIAI